MKNIPFEDMGLKKSLPQTSLEDIATEDSEFQVSFEDMGKGIKDLPKVSKIPKPKSSLRKALEGMMGKIGETSHYDLVDPIPHIIDPMSGLNVNELEVKDQLKIKEEKKKSRDAYFKDPNISMGIGLISPELKAETALLGLGVQPAGGFDEHGIPLDIDRLPYINPKSKIRFKPNLKEMERLNKVRGKHFTFNDYEDYKSYKDIEGAILEPKDLYSKEFEKAEQSIVVDTLDKLFKVTASAVKDPIGTTRGVAEIFTLYPEVVGIIGAVTEGARNAVHQVANLTPEEYKRIDGVIQPVKGKDFNMLVLYDAMSKAMHDEVMKLDPSRQAMLTKIFGKQSQASQNVIDIAASPIMAISNLGHEISKSSWFKNSPNLQGGIKLFADILGMIVTAKLTYRPKIDSLVHKRFKALPDDFEVPKYGESLDQSKDVVKEPDFIFNIGTQLKEAADIIKTEEQLAKMPDSSEKKAALHDLNIRRQKVEKTLQSVAESLGSEISIKEDLGRMQETKAKEKVYPIADSGVKKGRVEKPKVKVSEDIPVKETALVKKSKKKTKEVPIEEMEVNRSRIEQSTELEKNVDGTLKTMETPENVLAPESTLVLESPIPETLDRPKIDQTIEPTLLQKLEREIEIEHDRLDNLYGEVDVDRALRGVESKLPKGEIDNLVDMYKRLDEIEEINKKPLVEKPESKAPEIKELGIEEPEVKKQPKKRVPKASKITSIDEAIGVEPEGNNIDNSAFRQTAEQAERMESNYNRIGDKINNQPDLIVGKLINDINLWLNGKTDINIAQTKEMLRRLVEFSDRFEPMFNSSIEFYRWKDFVKEAAEWGTRAARVGDEIKTKPLPEGLGKKTKRGGVRLNIGIPLDIAGEYVVDVLREVQKRGEDFTNNIRMWRENGIWFDSLSKRFKFEAILGIDDIDTPTYFGIAGTLEKPYGLNEIVKNKRILNALGGGKDYTITMTASLLPDDAIILGKHIKIGAMPKDQYFKTRIAKILSHEFTHGIQKKYNLPPGGSPEMFLHNEVLGIINEIKSMDLEPVVKHELNLFAKQLDNIDPTNALNTLRKRISALEQNGIPVEASVYQKLQTPLNYMEAYRKYKKLYGEIDARLSEKRNDMSYKQRLEEPPWVTLEKMLKDEGLEIPTDITKHIVEPSPYTWPMMSKKLRVEDIEKMVADEQVSINLGLENKKAFRKNLKASELASALTFKKVRQGIVDATLNTKDVAREILLKYEKSPKLEPYAKAIRQRIVNEAGGHAEGQRQFKIMDKQCFGGLSREQIRVLFHLITNDRILDIASYREKIVFPEGQDPVKSYHYSKNFAAIEGLDAATAADLIARKENFFAHINRLIDIRQESGFIDKAKADSLKKHKYVMLKTIGERVKEGTGTEIESLFDNFNTIVLGGEIRSVLNSGIDSLQKGSKTSILESNQRMVALEIYNRVYGAKFRNDVFVSIADFISNNPNNMIGRFSKARMKALEKGLPEVVDKDTFKLPNKDEHGNIKHYYWEYGQRKAVYLSPKFAEGLNSAGTNIHPKVIAALNLVTLAPITKFMVTAVSPVWSTFLNLPMDIAHIYLSAGMYTGGKRTRLYSANPVLFAIQFGSDLKNVAYETIYRNTVGEKGIYAKLVKAGIEMPWLSTQAKLFHRGTKLPNKWNEVQNFLTAYSETLEKLPRVAIAQRTFKRKAKQLGISLEEAMNKKDIIEEATFNARDYLDFSQGGWFVKALDQIGVIFFNAGVQVLRGFVRAAKEDPKGFASMVTQGIAIPVVGLTLATLLSNSQTGKEIPSWQEENSVNIPFPDSFRYNDRYGVERGIYLSIPVGATYGFLKNIFKYGTHQMLRKAGMVDHDPSVKAIYGSFRQLTPDVMTLVPTVRAAIEYSHNIDLRSGMSITPKVLPGYEEHEYVEDVTPQWAKDVGEATGLSPDRLRKALMSVLGNNEWGWAIGTGYEKVYGNAPEDFHNENLASVLAEYPGMKRWLKFTTSGTEELKRQDADIAKADAEDYIDANKVNADAKNAYWGKSKLAEKRLNEYLYRPEILMDSSRHERLKARAKFIENITDLPDRNSWVRLFGQPARVKAKDFFIREQKANTPTKRDKLAYQESILRKVGGYFTDEFWKAYTDITISQDR